MLTLTNGFGMHLQRSGWGFRWVFVFGADPLAPSRLSRLSHRQHFQVHRQMAKHSIRFTFNL